MWWLFSRHCICKRATILLHAGRHLPLFRALQDPAATLLAEMYFQQSESLCVHCWITCSTTATSSNEVWLAGLDACRLLRLACFCKHQTGIVPCTSSFLHILQVFVFLWHCSCTPCWLWRFRASPLSRQHDFSLDIYPVRLWDCNPKGFQQC